MELADVRHLFIFDGLTDEQVGELLDAGEEVVFGPGDVLFHQADPAAFWWVLVEGRVALRRRAANEESVIGVMERPGVWAGGFLAWAESSGYLTTGQGASPGRMLRVPSAALHDLTQSWFAFGVHLIEGVFQNVRAMEAMSHQRESLVALGTLAAGLAHELNNPAAATARAVDSLDETCTTLMDTLVRFAEQSLTAEQFVAIDALRRELDEASAASDPLAVADRDDALSVWLDAHDVVEAWRIAPTLAAAGADDAWCERAAAALDPEILGTALDWIAGTVTTRTLLAEMRESSGRVSTLVGAVKSYSQLDRASVQLIDVREGIETTLVILGHKLRDGIVVEREFTEDVDRIEANPGELNQVWTNLVDNAIDAMDGQGTLRLAVLPTPAGIAVEVGDTGPGMAPEVQARVFDPFFTTKEVGKGTGLGLDISHRIVVERHHGEIEIDSSSAGTTFRVLLPKRQA